MKVKNKTMKKITLLGLVFAFASIAIFGIVYHQKTKEGITTKLEFLVEEKNVNQLSTEAIKVVIGTVEKVLPGKLSTEKINNSAMIYTDVVLSITNVLKGNSINRATVRIPGGTVGEGKQKRSILVEDIPEFKIGDQVVVFLGKGTDGLFQLPDEDYYTIYGGFQGTYTITDDLAINPKATLAVDQLMKEISTAIQK